MNNGICTKAKDAFLQECLTVLKLFAGEDQALSVGSLSRILALTISMVSDD
jgi:hypothetical protein